MPQKKSFKDNPALNFITTQTDPVVILEEDNLSPVKLNPEYIETRSKRLNLLIQPSLHKNLKNIAATRDISINELIHKALEEYVQKN